ncbi:MAG: tetratricopeptide repeat protein, partial [Planctomycetota bacterium]
MCPTAFLLLAAATAATPEAALLERAREALVARDPSRAVVLARRAIATVRAGRKLAESVHLHREAQDIVRAAGRGEDLVVIYDRFLRRDVADPLRRYLRARVELDPLTRRRDIQTVLAASPDLFWAAYDLAELFAREGDWRRAVRHAEKAAELRPGEATVWNVLGHLRLEQSRYLDTPADRKAHAMRAREALSKAVELDPKLAEAHYNLGLVSFALGESAAAARSWRRATEVRPAFAEAWNSLGQLAAHEGRADESIAHYKRAVSAREDYGAAHNNLAVAYYRKKDYARAQAHLARAQRSGHRGAESFRRVLVREIEKESFGSFMKSFGDGSRARITVRANRAREEGAKKGMKKGARPSSRRLTGGELRKVAAAVRLMSFRDSHGGARLGERRIG